MEKELLEKINTELDKLIKEYDDKGGVKMLEIRKIGEKFYLIGGEYIASTYSHAVIIANKNTIIKNFKYLTCKKISVLENLRHKFNYLFNTLEEWM